MTSAADWRAPAAGAHGTTPGAASPAAAGSGPTQRQRHRLRRDRRSRRQPARATGFAAAVQPFGTPARLQTTASAWPDSRLPVTNVRVTATAMIDFMARSNIREDLPLYEPHLGRYTPTADQKNSERTKGKIMMRYWTQAGWSTLAVIVGLLLVSPRVHARAARQIVHDAQFYILNDQNSSQWTVEDTDLDARLAALRQKYGRPPNIIHLMWDDQPFGAVGIPALQQLRGYATPRLNQMADEGILFTRMYSEPSCTPTRAAAMTGQIPVRNGMYKVGFPIEFKGLSKNTVSIASALSKAGFATAFYGKWHLGDIEESYLQPGLRRGTVRCLQSGRQLVEHAGRSRQRHDRLEGAIARQGPLPAQR